MHNEVRERIAQFARRYAPFSVVDRGITLAEEGCVRELSRTLNQISASVEDNADSFRTGLTLQHAAARSDGVKASCSCCSLEDMQEQWCPHAVALLSQSEATGLTTLTLAQAEDSYTPRINDSSAAEVAGVLRALARQGAEPEPAGAPSVSIALEFRATHLELRLAFDGVPQTRLEHHLRSPRELDNLLLHLLDDAGHFDDLTEVWKLESPPAIETCIGIVSEFSSLHALDDHAPLHIRKESLGARVRITWLPASVELFLCWILPDGQIVEAEHPVLGARTPWTRVGSELFRLSDAASRLQQLFPAGAKLMLPRASSAALLETLQEEALEHVEVTNPEAQPRGIRVAPGCAVAFRMAESPYEHFFSTQRIRIEGRLSFIYPGAAPGENVLYLPDRPFEEAARQRMLDAGFSEAEPCTFGASGDDALDFIHEDPAARFPEWTISGIEEIRAGLRMTAIEMELSLQRRKGAGAKKAGLEKIDWFECSIKAKRNGAPCPIHTLFQNLRYESERWLQLSDGSYARVPGGSLTQLKTTMGFLDSSFRLAHSIRADVSSAQALGLYSQAQTPFTLAADEAIEALAQKIRDFERIPAPKPSRRFKGTLRHYQAEGLGWLEFLHEYEFGGILADEMGLGKTVQALAMLQRLKERRKKARQPSLPSLIVAPTSVTTNWVYEAHRFTPDLKVALLYGPQRRALMSELNEYDIVITSYALLRLDRHLLETQEFYYVILDEAQHIKNLQAATTRAAKTLKARRRLALTGTPTENRPLELWSIFDFLRPGYLGGHEFFRNFIEKPIVDAGSGAPTTRLLNTRTRPFILRRTKAEVEKELPPKTETVLHVPMTPGQAQLYAEVLEDVRPRVLHAIDEEGIGRARVHILAALLRLRQICNHPNSIKAFRDLSGFDSGKFNALKELLADAVQNGRKVLLYSQFRDMLRLTREWADAEGVPYSYLDGHTTNRQQVIDEFNNDERIRLFLISLKAGGTGLNLTAADTVVIYDPWWNPAVEDQAIDRAHRIGQTKPISVYRLVTEDSIEQKVMVLKERKSKVNEALIGGAGVSTLELSRQDLEALLAPLPAGVLPDNPPE